MTRELTLENYEESFVISAARYTSTFIDRTLVITHDNTGQIINKVDFTDDAPDWMMIKLAHIFSSYLCRHRARLRKPIDSYILEKLSFYQSVDLPEDIAIRVACLVTDAIAYLEVWEEFSKLNLEIERDRTSSLSNLEIFCRLSESFGTDLAGRALKESANFNDLRILLFSLERGLEVLIKDHSLTTMTVRALRFLSKIDFNSVENSHKPILPTLRALSSLSDTTWDQIDSIIESAHSRHNLNHLKSITPVFIQQEVLTPLSIDSVELESLLSNTHYYEVQNPENVVTLQIIALILFGPEIVTKATRYYEAFEDKDQFFFGSFISICEHLKSGDELMPLEWIEDLYS